uniref:P-type ATPase C-terminal domain-containing protein n=1 Tax=Strombidium rassoulzadegani TaxID=1082188 RepID=A0A7S3CJ81_9SPIT|mmetsp:Transcript_12784/g.21616  ORF Transcript_12784/g.21616 Transcript_12784/m.21616 type:complete len:416 (+) Transcript_12784:2518-3765(+)
MEFLAVTGVEDKLQDHVLETIEKFRSAGIQVWMLTGDKIETAKCIAIATGMNNRQEGVHEIRGENFTKGSFYIKDSIESFDKTNKNKTMLMIDGQALAMITANQELTTRFFQAATTAKSVCVCRCSPTQKALVARYIKEYTKKRIACVGDGGNDVAMIQEADVGLGIVGKEGMQASLASDFSLIQFSHLKELILWHGRMSYQRSAKLSQFIIHRGMIISFIQAIFTMIFFSVTIPIYNGYLILGYSTVYTSLPVFSLVLDEDVDREICLKFPILYQTLQDGRSLNIKTFLIWTWKSIYQASIIMFLAVILFNDSFVIIMSITFTTLICIEFLNVIQEVTTVRRKMVVSIVGSLIVYVLTIIFFNTMFQMSAFDLEFVVKVGIITFASWVPVWGIKKMVEWLDPNAVMKVRKSEYK